MLVPTSCCMFEENHKPTGLCFGEKMNVHSKTTWLSHTLPTLAGSTSFSKLQKTQPSYLLQWPTSESNVWVLPSWAGVLPRTVCKEHSATRAVLTPLLSGLTIKTGNERSLWKEARFVTLDTTLSPSHGWDTIVLSVSCPRQVILLFASTTQ